MPTRYTLAAIQTIPKKLTNNKLSEINICHQGTPNGILINITIGEVNGINEKMVATVPCGSLITVAKPMYTPNINGSIIGSINCCVSVSLSTAAPIAA